MKHFPSHDVAFTPGAGDVQPAGELVYREHSSRARGLYVLMQDASARATPARRRFLLACFRDTVSAYLAPDRLVGSVAFLRERVIAFDRLSRAVDTRLDDVEELGIFVAVREPGGIYILCARGGLARVRWRGVFVPLSTPEVDGVRELSIETARSQQDLFAQALPETLALYRVTPGVEELAERELLLGGTAQDMAIVADMMAQTRDRDVREITTDRIRHTVLMLGVDSSAPADAPVATGPASRVRRGRGRVPSAVVIGAVALVVLAAGVVAIGSWRNAGRHDGAGAGLGAAKQSPAPPPPQERVAQDVKAVEERAVAREDRVGFGVAWQQTFRGAVTSSPAVAGDAVVFGGRDGRVYSVHRGSGERQWAYRAQGGVGASPVVRGATVIAADYAGNVVRLRAGDGGMVWKRALGEKIVSTPAVTSERVLAGTLKGRIYALSLETGRVLWKFSARGPVRGSIAHAKGTFLVPSNDGRLYALVEETGARRWVLPLGGPVVSSPASDGNIVVVGSSGGDVVAVDLDSGKPRWKYRTGGAVNSSLAIVDGHVYAGSSDRRLYCIDARNGDLRWRFDTGGVILSRPFVEDGRVVVTSYDGAIYCVDAASGDLIDRYETDEAIFSSPVVVEGRVFFGNNGGRFYCLDSPES